MNGEKPQINGQHLPNGATSTDHHLSTEAKIARIDPKIQHIQKHEKTVPGYTNGIVESPIEKGGNIVNRLGDIPLEILQLVTKDNFVPVSILLNRRVQSCWNRLSSLVNDLSEETIRSAGSRNDEKANARKKERILEFAYEQRSDFIKLLVLLDWSSRSGDFAKVASLNQWLHDQRRGFLDTSVALAFLKKDSVNFQIPNPDFKTASEVLCRGAVSSFPDIGYRPVKPFTDRQILSTLKRINRALSIRLITDEQLPNDLAKYHIHDGRVTFHITNEFEVDLSLLDESPSSQFRLVDFRFLFLPRPSISDQLRTQVEYAANSAIDKDGLAGCYEFFHALTLTNKVAEYHRQALKASNKDWGRSLKAELHRRTLVVQYWSERSIAKSWIEIGVHSGSQKDSSFEAEQSRLGFRWFREGVEVKDFELHLDPEHMSLESVLYQIIAQHINYNFDTLYDRLVEATIFQDGNLVIEQHYSSDKPQDCSMSVQITRQNNVRVSIDPVSGSVLLSPASARNNQLQRDLNRNNSVTTDFVPKLLNYRSAVAEDEILEDLRKTSWKRLEAFRPLENEVSAVFKRTFTRSNFFRHPAWSPDFAIVITQGNEADMLWILQIASSFAASTVIHSQPISICEEVSPSYFESFADYSSGLILLHCIGRELKRIGQSYKVGQIPTFDGKNELPSLQLSLRLGLSETKHNLEGYGHSLSSVAEVQYLTIDSGSRQAKLVVKLRAIANPAVLRLLAQSNPDANIEFFPEDKRININVFAVVGEPLVQKAWSRIMQLNDSVASVQLIEKMPNMTLTAVTQSSLLIAYQLGQSESWSMEVGLPTAAEGPKLVFMPKDTNAHTYLAPQLKGLLQDESKSFVQKLSSIISTLTLTYPLLSTLQKLQKNSSFGSDDKLRVHILIRQPTMFAIQFFAVHTKQQSAVSLPSQNMLARFEVLPYHRQKNMWLIRPAIEEINSYSRASFASKELQTKIKETIFAKQDETSEWMCLDSAAVCLVDKPEPLIKALHQTVLEWVKENPEQMNEAMKSPTKAEKPQQAPATKAPPANSGNKPATKPASQPNKQMANGVNNQRPKNAPNKQQQAMAAKNKTQEVITLD